MRTCSCSSQQTGWPFHTCKFHCQNASVSFWGKSAEKKNVDFHNSKVKLVAFHKKDVFKHTGSNPVAQELASTAGIWYRMRKIEALLLSGRGPSWEPGKWGLLGCRRPEGSLPHCWVRRREMTWRKYHVLVSLFTLSSGSWLVVSSFSVSP